MADQTVKFVGERILRIPFRDNKEAYEDRVTRGESIASAHHSQPYIEKEPSVKDWVQEHWPSKSDVKAYGLSLFPFIDWLPRYNVQWLFGDLVAGITVGCVVVPQSMCSQSRNTPCCGGELTFAFLRYGICSARTAAPAIRSIFLFRRCYALLGFCYE